MKRLLTVTVLVIALVLASAGAIGATGENANNTLRIDLEVPEGQSDWLAGATGKIQIGRPYADDHPNWADFPIGLAYQIKGLSCLDPGWLVDGEPLYGGDLMYSIYVYTPSRGLQRLQNFNTSCTLNDFTSLVRLSDFSEEELFDEYVSVGVFIENDNGLSSGDSRRDLLVLEGHSDEALLPVVGESTVFFPVADSCGFEGREHCESLVGNAVVDAVRETYNTDFAFYNSAAFRADLTCPIVDDPFDSCPSYIPPNFPITTGQIEDTLIFDNNVFTVNITGPELKTILEHSVAPMPTANANFAQVSGLCFTYDIDAAPGSRITSVVRQDADGACTTDQVDLSASSTYSLAENSFNAGGGGGYPDFIGQARGLIRDKDRAVLASYIAANSPISPTIDGRISCTGASCPITNP